MFHLRLWTCMYTATPPPTQRTNTTVRSFAFLTPVLNPVAIQTCSIAPRSRALHLLGYVGCPAAPRIPLSAGPKLCLTHAVVRAGYDTPTFSSPALPSTVRFPHRGVSCGMGRGERWVSGNDGQEGNARGRGERGTVDAAVRAPSSSLRLSAYAYRSLARQIQLWSAHHCLPGTVPMRLRRSKHLRRSIASAPVPRRPFSSL
jgi:hypothetical protein